MSIVVHHEQVNKMTDEEVDAICEMMEKVIKEIEAATERGDTNLQKVFVEAGVGKVVLKTEDEMDLWPNG